MKIFLNGLGASAGGGLTYLKNVLPHLAALPGVRTTAAVGHEFEPDAVYSQNVELLRIPSPGGAARRFWFEQKKLPNLVRDSGADILISTGNFALRRSPIPQILLSRNSLYTCPEFFRDLARRREYRIWLDTRIKAILAKKSVQWADRTIAPSESFARDLHTWTGKPVVAIHHGFDHDLFFKGENALPNAVREKLATPPGVLRVLLVSHYNYYRNFETVFRALAQLRERTDTPPARLFLTCELRTDKTPGAYRPESAARLIESLGIREQVVELGAVPYDQLSQVYASCDLFITAAYSETFAHPLAEAMASGIPVIASDLPVHREICGDAALYFPRFSPAELASRFANLGASPAQRQQMISAGRERSRSFSWKLHVEKLLSVARDLTDGSASRNQAEPSVTAA